MELENTEQNKSVKIKKPLTGVQAVALIFGVTYQNVSKIITGKSLCTPERVELYINELNLVGRAIEEHIEKRKIELTNQKNEL
jgi:hypothetical protein